MSHFYVAARYRTLKLGDLKTVLKQLCILGLLSATVLVSTSDAALAGGRRGRSHPRPPQPLVSPVGSVEPQNEFVDPVYEGADYAGNGDSYWNDPTYWTEPTGQSSSQEAITNAVATGDRSTATSNVNQFSYQSRYGDQGGSGNQYWSAPSIQISVQQATANAVANGNNTTAASNIHQMNHQEDWNSGGWGDGYDYETDPHAQVSTQQAVGNAIATGDHSNATSNIDQTNVQDYSQDYSIDPGYFDYGYGYGY